MRLSRRRRPRRNPRQPDRRGAGAGRAVDLPRRERPHAGQRSAVARTGAAIVAGRPRLGHRHRVAAADLRKLRRAGFKVIAHGAHDRLPERRRRLPQLRRDDGRDQRARRRQPGDRQRFSHRHLLRGPRPGRDQDLRQRRDRRGRARGPVHRRPARARAPHDRDGALPAPSCSQTRPGHARRPLVNTREIWIVPNLNPDGSEYDIATGSYRSWRKNRQPNAGSTAVGTDLNRNWGFNWGCCGGSSGTFSSETYRGAVGVLGARDPASCATSSTAAWSAACSRSRPTSTSTPTPSSCCGRTATRPRTRRRR